MRQTRIREALGRIYDQHPPELREQFRRLEADPKSRIFAPLTESLRRLGRVDEAIEICKKGLLVHPDYVSGHLALAKCFIDRNKFEEARQELERVIGLSPENLLAHRLLGDMLLGLEDRKGAIHHYKMALLLAPEDVALHEKIRGLETVSEETLSGQVSLPELEAEAVGLPKPRPVIPEGEMQEVASYLHVPQSAEADEDFVISEPLWIESEESDEDETDNDGHAKAQINRLLGLKENEEEDASFKSEPFACAFMERERERNKEITTETLAELYLSQGQTEEALEMLERLYKRHPTKELLGKLQGCRIRLGVDQESLVRQRQIEALRGILRRQRESHK